METEQNEITLLPVKLGTKLFLANVSKESGKYEAMIIIPKNDYESVEELERAIIGSCSNDPSVATLSDLKVNPVKDGDDPSNSNSPFLKGCWYVYAKATVKPLYAKVSYADNTLVKLVDTVKSELYSGAIVSISIKAICYEPKSVTLVLTSVIKIEDAEPIAVIVPTVVDSFINKLATKKGIQVTDRAEIMKQQEQHEQVICSNVKKKIDPSELFKRQAQTAVKSIDEIV